MGDPSLEIEIGPIYKNYLAANSKSVIMIFCF